MSTIADLLIKVRADTGGAERDIASFGSKVGGGFKKALLPATAALGVLGVVGKAAFSNLQDGANNAKQTEAVLKSTGSVAGVTASHVDDLAMSLRRKAGVDDDVIHSGENMLLTFTNIRNEVGRGNDIYDQATKTMLDMSHALGQDTKSSAIQLGKALNDPIKGVTALQRVGVTFTDSQRKQIKTLVDSGHTMAAQKLILHELNREFGGSAENIDPTTKALANMKLNAIDLASGLVQSLMPAIRVLSGLVEAATGFMTQHGTATKIVVGIMAGLAVGVIAVNIAMKLYAAGAAVVTAAQWLLGASLWATVLPLAAITLAVGILALAAYEIYKHWAPIAAFFSGLWNTIRDAFIADWDLIKRVFFAVFDAIKSAFITVVNWIIDRINGITGAYNAAFGWLTGNIGKIGHIGDQTGKALSSGIIDSISAGLASANFSVSVAAKVTATNPLGLSYGPGSKSWKGAAHASGIMNAPESHWAMVGERGPELMYVPQGSSIFPHGAGPGGPSFHVENVNVRSDEDVRLWARDVARRLGA